MKSMPLAATLFTALALVTTVSAHADVSMQPVQGIQSNGIKLNGLSLNGPGIVIQGRTFNGPGIVFQGRAFNGPGLVLQGRNFNGYRMNGIGLNGPGLVLQARNFNGFRVNGSAFAGFDVDRDQAPLVSSDACSAPQPAREWPLSALHASSVKVRLAPR